MYNELYYQKRNSLLRFLLRTIPAEVARSATNIAVAIRGRPLSTCSTSASPAKASTPTRSSAPTSVVASTFLRAGIETVVRTAASGVLWPAAGSFPFSLSFLSVQLFLTRFQDFGKILIQELARFYSGKLISRIVVEPAPYLKDEESVSHCFFCLSELCQRPFCCILGRTGSHCSDHCYHGNNSILERQQCLLGGFQLLKQERELVYLFFLLRISNATEFLINFDYLSTIYQRSSILRAYVFTFSSRLIRATILLTHD